MVERRTCKDVRMSRIAEVKIQVCKNLSGLIRLQVCFMKWSVIVPKTISYSAHHFLEGKILKDNLGDFALLLTLILSRDDGKPL